MRIDLHCMLCGGMLTRGEEHTTCLSCGAEYSNILVSEDIPFDEGEPLEVSVSMEGTFVKRETKVPVPLGNHSAVEESIAV
ncbi:MAG: hypothetical protein V3V92_00625 [Candidatus Hydrothermarchaeales archaeon]